MKRPVYLDNNATTAMDGRVFEAMRPYFCEQFGNAASSSHSYGHEAAQAVETARGQVARLIGADVKEIVWTSGATESNNLAIKGVARRYREKGRHIITCVTEHKAVLDTCRDLEQQGFEVTYLPVDSQGMIDLGQLEEAIREETILVSLMAVNNETGVVHPLEEIGAITRGRGVLFHCDGTQGAGKMAIDVKAMKIDLLSMSGHKMYGPKGVGALYVSRRGPVVRPSALIHGGGHEGGVRSGTLNVPGIVGMGMACQICYESLSSETARLKELSGRLWNNIHSQIEDVTLNGDPGNRLPSVLNMTFAYVEGESIMLAMPDVAVSSGSACTSTTLEPSYVLGAMGISKEAASCSLRFSLGRWNTRDEMDLAAASLVKAVGRLRDMSPLYHQAKKEKGIDHAI